MTKYNLNWSYEVEETESYPTPHQQDQEDNITRSSVLPYKNDSSLQYLIDSEYFSIVVLFTKYQLSSSLWHFYCMQLVAGIHVGAMFLKIVF